MLVVNAELQLKKKYQNIQVKQNLKIITMNIKTKIKSLVLILVALGALSTFAQEDENPDGLLGPQSAASSSSSTAASSSQEIQGGDLSRMSMPALETELKSAESIYKILNEALSAAGDSAKKKGVLMRLKWLIFGGDEVVLRQYITSMLRAPKSSVWSLSGRIRELQERIRVLKDELLFRSKVIDWNEKTEDAKRSFVERVDGLSAEALSNLANDLNGLIKDLEGFRGRIVNSAFVVDLWGLLLRSDIIPEELDLVLPNGLTEELAAALVERLIAFFREELVIVNGRLAQMPSAPVLPVAAGLPLVGGFVGGSHL